MTLQEILESVKSGSVSVEEAERILKKESYEEMGYAKLDTSRKARTGFAEVIYCSNKAAEFSYPGYLRKAVGAVLRAFFHLFMTFRTFHRQSSLTDFPDNSETPP